MKKSFGTLNQLKTAVENRIDELEMSNPSALKSDLIVDELVESSSAIANENNHTDLVTC